MSTPPDRVSGDAASFIGNIPEHYDSGLGSDGAFDAVVCQFGIMLTDE